MSATPRWVSDTVVDLLVEAGIDHVAFNPGASFRGLHDSLVARGSDGPRLVLCLHEEISVAIAHGYAKATGRPMAALLHDVVGLQHAAMTIYNAWCDRVPVLLVGGTGPLSTANRRPWIDWIHTANVQGQQVRDYVKWDDQPADAASIPRAFARALAVAQATPAGPVYLCLDAGLQEEVEAVDRPDWPGLAAFGTPTPPAASGAELEALAAQLRAARLPVLVSDYAGDTRAGYEGLVALAELLHAPVVDRGARMNFPVGHELDFAALPDILDEADLVVAFEVEDLFGALAGRSPDRVVNVAAGHLRWRSWAHDAGELPAVDRTITASPETALPALVERVRQDPPDTTERARRIGLRARDDFDARWARARSVEAADAVAPERLAAEAWDVLGPHDPVVVSSRTFDPERRLWPLRGFRAHLGWHGGGGLGYGLGASIGAALALGGDRLCVDLQPDGDLLFTPQALWTAAHLSVALLILVANNRQYRNTVEHGASIAALRGRPAGNRYVGATLGDPPVDLAGLARSFGVWATGPIDRAQAVAPALTDALEIVRGGRPALVEVLTTGA